MEDPQRINSKKKSATSDILFRNTNGNGNFYANQKMLGSDSVCFHTGHLEEIADSLDNWD